MKIRLNYNQYSLMGRLKFSIDYKEMLNGYTQSLFGEGVENSKEQIVFVSAYGTETYYK